MHHGESVRLKHQELHVVKMRRRWKAVVNCTGTINYGLALCVASTNPTPHTTNKQHAAFPSYYGDELIPIMINSIMCNFMFYLYCMVIAQP